MSTTDDDEWRRVASRADIRAGGLFAAVLGETPIVLTEIEGQIFAVSDTCTHESAPLSEGFVEGGEIECPLHQARFDVRTGSCLGGPATQDLDTFEVKVEGDDVYVKMPG